MSIYTIIDYPLAIRHGNEKLIFPATKLHLEDSNMELRSIVLSQFQLAFLRWWILPWVLSRMYTDDHYSIIIGQKVIYHHVDFETHIIILRYYKLYISIMIVCCLPLDFIWLALSNTYVSWFLDDHPNGLGWDQKPVITSHQYDISPYGPQNESIQ